MATTGFYNYESRGLATEKCNLAGALPSFGHLIFDIDLGLGF